MKQGDATNEPQHDDPEQTKEELEAEFDPNDKGKGTISFFFVSVF